MRKSLAISYLDKTGGEDDNDATGSPLGVGGGDLEFCGLQEILLRIPVSASLFSPVGADIFVEVPYSPFLSNRLDSLEGVRLEGQGRVLSLEGS